LRIGCRLIGGSGGGRSGIGRRRRLIRSSGLVRRRGDRLIRGRVIGAVRRGWRRRRHGGGQAGGAGARQGGRPARGGGACGAVVTHHGEAVAVARDLAALLLVVILDLPLLAPEAVLDRDLAEELVGAGGPRALDVDAAVEVDIGVPFGIRPLGLADQRVAEQQLAQLLAVEGLGRRRRGTGGGPEAEDKAERAPGGWAGGAHRRYRGS